MKRVSSYHSSSLLPSVTNDQSSFLSSLATTTFLNADCILLGKRKDVIHQTTIATRTGIVAIIDLLFAQRYETARG